MKPSLLDRLMQEPGVDDNYAAKRGSPRTALQGGVMLEVRTARGKTMTATVFNVSVGGIGVLCRDELRPFDKIEMRMAFEDDAEYESFVVKRVTPTASGFQIGVEPV